MQFLLPPLCLLLALAMLVAGFALLAVEPPEADWQLHQARVTGDESATEVLEAALVRRQFARKVLLVCLFSGSLVMVVAAFAVMRPSGPG